MSARGARPGGIATVVIVATLWLAADARAQVLPEIVRLQIGEEHRIDAHDVESYSGSLVEDLEYREQPRVLVARFTTAGTFTVYLRYEDGHERVIRFIVG